MMKFWLALALCGFGPLLAAPAFADATAAVEQAKAFLTDADQLFLARDYEHARLKYATAYGLVPSVDILWSLAVCEYESGHYADALWRFRQYVHDPKARPWRVQEATRDYIPEATKRSGQVEVSAAPGSVIVVDSVFRVGTVPLSDAIPVAPGHHSVEARGVEGPLLTTGVDVPAGMTVRVKLISGDVHASAPVAPAMANGASWVAPQAAGASAVSLNAHSSEEPHGKDMASASGSPHSFWSPRTILAASLGGAAVVAAGVGTYFAIHAKNASDSARQITNDAPICVGANPSPRCPELQALKSTRDSSQTAAEVSFVAGGVLAVGAAVTFFAWKDAPRTQALWFAPTFAQRGAGAQFGGDF